MTLYIPSITGRIVTIPPSEQKHIKVLRLHHGDRVDILDGRGGVFTAELLREGKETKCRILEKRITERDILVDLAQGATNKLPRMDFLVEKATELGVNRIIPLRTSSSSFPKQRIDRWRRIAISAIKQSHNPYLPTIDEITDFEDLLHRFPSYDSVFIAYEKEEERRIEDITGSKILGIVGPEGGFSEKEIRDAVQNGATPVNISNHRLRSETAGLVLLSHIMHVLKL